MLRPFSRLLLLRHDGIAQLIQSALQRAAQLMLLVGDGGSYDEKPDYEANLAFATRLTEGLNALSPGLCRPVLVKHGRYNQHVGTPSLLVEAGHNLNTLEEALRAMPPLAEALCGLLAGE